ncbi:hypothetical protein LUZ60_005653 [Juncus effusus]|nr:hypothetical protein LUZ60_005653 [Juncus effusus]
MAAKIGEKTSFTVACGLLSQLVREKGNLANLNLGSNEVSRTPKTMNLFPGLDDSSEKMEKELQKENHANENILDSKKNENLEMELFPRNSVFSNDKEESKESNAAQLTIFYGGKVLVFENCPSEKAKDLMELATKSISIPHSSSSTPTQIQIHTEAPKSTQPTTSDLPIMRKASLQRFLAKRKDRISEKAPYQVPDSPIVASVKKVKNESWLGLGPNVTKLEF